MATMEGMPTVKAMETNALLRKAPLVDFHAHILPGVDHGCRHLQTALEQLGLAEQYGIKTIVATPHFYPNRHVVEDFVALRDAAYGRLLTHRPSQSIHIVRGAEILLYPGLHRMQGIERLCIEGTDNLLLLELPIGVLSDGVLESIYELKARGFQPLMAHLDRYPTTEVKKVLALKVKTQLNADAFSTFFSRRRARKLMETDTVYALGSDIHGTDRKSYPGFISALQHLGTVGEELMTRANTLLNNPNRTGGTL